jgi:starch synthase
MPRYRGVEIRAERQSEITIRAGAIAETVRLLEARVPAGYRIVVADVPSLYNREGKYGQNGQDYADNAQRFAVLALAALEYAMVRYAEWPVDAIHAHDWQAGLVPTWIRAVPDRFAPLAQAGVVLTIHNLAFQGLFPKDVVPALGLPWSVFTMDKGEFWGQFSFLKAGIAYSDVITTVSPAYARETLKPAFGVGMEGVLKLRSNRYMGILNGVDVDSWNPSSDPALPAGFDVGDRSGKVACKRALLQRFGWSQGDDALARPIVAVISRLADQKGLDLLADVAPQLASLDATWVIVGAGDARYESFFRHLATRYPTRVGVHIGFDDSLVRLATAGADMFLMPSRFEPCGLGQLYALRYGTVPIVTPVGGLDDTIRPYTKRAKHANGFKLRDVSSLSLLRTVKQALRLFRDKDVWDDLIRNGMTTDVSWQTAAREYVKVYRQALDIAAIRGGL